MNSFIEQLISAGGRNLQLIVSALVFWPVWVWYWERVTDRSDEPLGIVAVITLIMLIVMRTRAQVQNDLNVHQTKSNISGSNTTKADTGHTDVAPKSDKAGSNSSLICILLLVVYCIAVMVAPHAVQALIALITLLCLIRLATPNITLVSGDWVLTLLSLPVVATVNFYLGYPLRCFIATASCMAINLFGASAKAAGSELIAPTGMVEVDAPCSGVKMLWFCCYLAAAFSSHLKLSPAHCAILLCAGIISALAGNILRVSCLFFIETSQQYHSNYFIHQAVGTVAFLFSASVPTLLALCFSRLVCSKQLSNRTPASSTAALNASASAYRASGTPLSQQFGRVSSALLLMTLGAAALLPLAQKSQPAVIFDNYTWPGQFEGKPLAELPLSSRQKTFLRGFPGQVKLFSDGKRKIIWRIVVKETRQLHPSADCYRGMGYSVDLLPILVESSGVRWNRFRASNEREKLDVRETIEDAQAKHWTDVSSWYWDAFLRKTKGPWQVITVVSKGE